MAIYQLDDDIPRIADTAWVADSAQVIGHRFILTSGGGSFSKALFSDS